MTKPLNWTRLTTMQLGQYAEYFAKMEFTLYGYDVYTAEVDDKGIDFVVRSAAGVYYEIQVKSSCKGNYIFFPKHKFMPRPNLLAAIVLFTDGSEPEIYLIPSVAWLTPTVPLVERNYEGKKSKPEWGLELAMKHRPSLQAYRFETVVESL